MYQKLKNSSGNSFLNYFLGFLCFSLFLLILHSKKKYYNFMKEYTELGTATAVETI